MLYGAVSLHHFAKQPHDNAEQYHGLVYSLYYSLWRLYRLVAYSKENALEEFHCSIVPWYRQPSWCPNVLSLWALGLQDGCHYHGKSKQCEVSIQAPRVSMETPMALSSHLVHYFYGSLGHTSFSSHVHQFSHFTQFQAVSDSVYKPPPPPPPLETPFHCPWGKLKLIIRHFKRHFQPPPQS